MTKPQKMQLDEGTGKVAWHRSVWQSVPGVSVNKYSRVFFDFGGRAALEVVGKGLPKVCGCILKFQFIRWLVRKTYAIRNSYPRARRGNLQRALLPVFAPALRSAVLGWKDSLPGDAFVFGDALETTPLRACCSGGLCRFSVYIASLFSFLDHPSGNPPKYVAKHAEKFVVAFPPGHGKFSSLGSGRSVAWLALVSGVITGFWPNVANGGKPLPAKRIITFQRPRRWTALASN